jgi:hypothetical protein
MFRIRVSATIFLLCILLLESFYILRYPSVAVNENPADVHDDSYTIFHDNGITGALNGTTQAVEFSSVDANEVIRSAVEALPSFGGRICFRAGRYAVVSPIVLDKPCSIEGEGSGRSYPEHGVTQIDFGNTTGFKIVSAGVRICHLQLRGCGDEFSGCVGIHLDTSLNALNQNLNIEDVMIVDTYYAVYGTGSHDIWDLYLSDVYVNHCNEAIRIDKADGAVQLQTNHVIISHAKSDAVYLTRVDAVILDSIYFVEPLGNGIVIASFVSYPLMIRNCQLDECHENGILLAFEEPCSLWLTVTDTQIKAYRTAILLSNAQDVIISNCHMAASQMSGSNESIFYAENSYRVQVNDCLIKNLSNATRDCLELRDSRYCQVAGCHVDHSVGNAVNVDFTIKETGTESNCNQIVNNICVGAQEGPVKIYGAASINQNNI